MAKRGRRELARLNAQTQFSLEWPATPPAAEERLVRAVKVLGNASRAMGGELRPGLVLGVNAVTRALEQTVECFAWRDDARQMFAWRPIQKKHCQANVCLAGQSSLTGNYIFFLFFFIGGFPPPLHEKNEKKCVIACQA